MFFLLSHKSLARTQMLKTMVFQRGVFLLDIGLIAATRCYRKGADGKRTGEPLRCHGTTDKDGSCQGGRRAELHVATTLSTPSGNWYTVPVQTLSGDDFIHVEGDCPSVCFTNSSEVVTLTHRAKKACTSHNGTWVSPAQKDYICVLCEKWAVPFDHYNLT